jgi:hypothetical protein
LTLSEAAWKHIRKRHPEVSTYRELVKATVDAPEVILQGSQGERKAVKPVETHLGQKYLVVVYRERKFEKAIITAYFTSDLKRIKGELVWKT